MKCHNCGWDIKHEVCWNDDIPAYPYCSACYDDLYCECGRKAWNESGLCIDCLSEAEAEAELRHENAVEA